MLDPLGAQIDEVENGKEAVYKASNTPYDLIFMDSHMPLMSGEEATREIRKLDDNVNQHVTIIALTADAVAGVRERLLASGMDDYVSKPIQTQDLYQVIRKYLPENKMVELTETAT